MSVSFGATIQASLEAENAQLRHTVAEIMLEIQASREALEGLVV